MYSTIKVLILIAFVSGLSMCEENNLRYLEDTVTKTFRQKIPVRETQSSAGIMEPYLDSFCIGTPAQCFSVIVDFSSTDSIIISNSVSCSFKPQYNSGNSKSYVTRDKTQYNEENVFGLGPYIKANETVKINNLEITNFQFNHLVKILRCSKLQGNGLIGLGYQSSYLVNLKQSNIIEKEIYSYKYVNESNGNYYDVIYGDMLPDMKANSDNISYCKITKSDSFLLSYWGCKVDIYVRLNSKNINFAFKDQPILFGDIMNPIYDGEIMFAGMREKYQAFIKESLLSNSSLCAINTQTTMFECEDTLKITDLPNLLFVMEGVTYVFKPQNLFHYDESTKKNILKISFPMSQKNFNHIVFSRQFLIDNNVSVTYDSEQSLLGFSGFNTHKYTGENDDGNDNNSYFNRINKLVIFLVLLIYLTIL